MGEHWNVNSQTGSLSVSVPIATSPGRGASSAELSLNYAGGTRSAYGYGWSLSVPAITRRGAKRLATYTDDDVFTLPGHDDLVPSLEPDGTGGWQAVEHAESIDGTPHLVRRYRPRADDTRTRIERCTPAAGGVPFWRTTAAGNVTRTFGRTPDSRITDPGDPSGRRVSEWLVDEVRDSLGNVATYEYKREDTANVTPQPGEQHRLVAGAPLQPNRYPKRIRYANATPDDSSTARLLVVLDYGEHDLAPAEARTWPARNDAYSVYTAGFEVRTYRRLRRVMVFHDFGADLGPGPIPRLVRTVELTHDATLSRLTALRQVGYQWTGAAYATAALPSVEFGYLDPVTADEITDLPLALRADGAHMHFVDLDGDGLPGVLASTPGGWWYQPPAGGGRYDPPQRVPQLPPTGAAGTAGLGDVDGTGRVGVAADVGGLAGTSVRRSDGSWDRYRPYLTRAVADLADPRLQRLDLSGDGLADLVRRGADAIRWTESLGRDGYGATRTIPSAADERDGPRPGADDVGHEWFCVDMSGDGLQDLVRVRGGRVDYWPNLGWGRHGARVTMTGTLEPGQPLDGARIRFADLDGTGTADLLYLGDHHITAWRNQHGTSWSAPEVHARVPRVDSLGEVQFVDLLGAGTPCLVWTSSQPGAPAGRYLDLAVQGPPHRLCSIVNNMGATTTFGYDTSARQQLAAARIGRPWRGTTSSASVVVARVQADDDVSQTRHVTRFTYRDAWSDPVERESRGFGYAETVDAETIGGGAFDLPAVRTCEWFATGLPGDRQGGIFTADVKAPLLAAPDRVGVTGGREFAQSARAFAGRAVRTETWVDDGGPDAPVVVTQTRPRVRQLQPCDGERPAVFRVEPLESITAHYERSTDDPRITHDLTLGTDANGTPISTASVAYRRRVPQIDEQNQVLMTWTVTEASSTDDSTAFLVSHPTAVRQYEITNLPVPPAGRHDPATLATLLPTLAERDFAAPVTPGLAERRLRSATRYEYWNDALSAALPAPQLGRRALVRRVLRFALTPDLITSTFGGLVTPAILTGEGGYEQIDGHWWVTDGIRGYSAAACYLPADHTTPFANTSTVTWDSHHLLVVATAASTTAPLSLNTRQLDNDYLTLAPRNVTDANGVSQRVEVDPLGRVVRSWRRAPDGTGDPDPLPGATFDYGDDAWHSGAGPCWSHAARREQHGDPAASSWQQQRMFVDGFGRIAMTKTSAEPGEAWADDGAGGVVTVDTTPNPRWIGTGRTVFDNKGNPVEQYEPYFATTAAFDTSDALVKHTVLQRRGYDALGRLVRVDHPDGTVETVQIGPWQQVNADRNDTVLTSDWFLARQGGGGASAAEQRAATLAAAHANTPLVQLCDALGRIVRTHADNGADGVYETRFALDVAGEMHEVHDASGIRVGTQLQDAAGRILRTESIDAGTQLVLPDAAGRRLRHATAVGHVVTSRYDPLGRQTQLRVRDSVTNVERVAEYTVYGETHPQAAARMLIGQVHRRYDDAGLSMVERYDLAGTVVAGTRQLLAGSTLPDWSGLVGQPLSALDAAAAPLLSAESFTTTGTFDALGRSQVQHLADGSRLTLGYRGDALATLTGRFAGTVADIPLVTATEHDARRHRTAVHHGNGVVVRHDYDEPSGRPIAITARAGNTTIQDLGYTYDPMGNVVQVQDAAAQPVFFAGAVVSPGALFTYDPTYRLRTATGREHSSLGQQPNRSEPAQRPLPHPNDANALRTYTESYSYDSVGNILRMAHSSPTLSWTRHYDYTPNTNRLAAHQLPGNPDAGPYSATFDYDAAGNTTRTPNLAAIAWDHRGRMVGADLGGGGTVTYQHDGSGNRVRKIWQRNGSLREERICLGDLEIFRRYRSNVLVLERRTVRVLDGKRTLALVETLVVDTDNPGFDDTPRVRYQLADLLGSSGVECDEAGAVIAYEEYHPFGTTALWLAKGAAATSARRYRYLGKEKDEETGFYRLGARLYCCWLGRWLNPDPAGLIDGVNRYSYAGNNPVSRIDPTGLADEIPWVQMFLTESKDLRFQVKATGSGNFQKKHYRFAAKEADLWGGAPPGYVLGHAPETPMWKQPIGQISDVGIQAPDLNARQSVGERADSQAAKARGEPARVGRKTKVSVANPPKGQPRLSTGAIEPKPLTVGGKVAPKAGPMDAAVAAWKPSPVKPPPGPVGQQLKLPGVQTEYQLKLSFDQPAAPKTAPVATTAPTGSPQQVELFKQPANTATTVTNDAAKTADAAKDSATLTKTTSGATEASTVTKAVDNAKPAVGGTTTVAKDATAVSEVTKDAAKVTEVAKDTAKVTDVAKDANAVAELTKDASVVSKAAPVAQDANALAKTAETVAPAAKAAAPAVKEAGALSTTVTKVGKVAAPVVKVVKPVAKVVGEVAKPLGVGLAAADLVTANNNTDRMVASGDLVAGVAVYCGPVGEAFSVGYTVGGLADQGIEKASKAAFGVDLSPSNGIAKVLDAQDKLISAMIPDDPKKPAYKNENKFAWFMIDTLGF